MTPPLQEWEIYEMHTEVVLKQPFLIRRYWVLNLDPGEV